MGARVSNTVEASTDPIRSAGSDGRPVEGENRSAMNESENNSWRCSAKNANTLPAGTSAPTSACASNNSRSTRLIPCTTTSSHATQRTAVRHDQQ